MQKFKTIKTLARIRAQCKVLRVPFDDYLYRNGDWDHVAIGVRGKGEVFFNTVNGTFFGRTPDGKRFDMRTDAHERQPWFQMLLRFFYADPVDPLPAFVREALEKSERRAGKCWAEYNPLSGVWSIEWCRDVGQARREMHMAANSGCQVFTLSGY